MCKSTNEKIPKFNSPMYFENKTEIGKIDEIFGPINEVVSPFFLRCFLNFFPLSAVIKFSFESIGHIRMISSSSLVYPSLSLLLMQISSSVFHN